MLKSNTHTATRHFVKGLSFNGFHRISYLEWGAENDNTMVCVHGVSRNAHDFDVLAKRLSPSNRVICPDVVGRGHSDHLINADGYDYLQYNADMNVLLGRIGPQKVDWLGTSMGGIIGMVFASLPQTPIKRLIVNDIGPFIARDNLTTIGEYIGRSGEFRNLAEVETYLREIYAEFHPMSDQDWADMAEHSSKRTSRGTYRMRMDAGVGDSFRNRISLFDVDMWDTWDNIQCPVLILRGENSSFFARETAEEMLTRGPKSTLIEFPHAGHTPSLRGQEQIDAIVNWLDETA